MNVFSAEERVVFNKLRASLSNNLKKGLVHDPFTKTMIDAVRTIDRVEKLLHDIDDIKNGGRAGAAASRGLAGLREQIGIIEANDAAYARSIACRGERADP